MDNYDKIAGVYGEGAEAAAGTGMAGQPWRVGVVKSVDPYRVEIAGGIIFEKEKLLYQLDIPAAGLGGRSN